MSADNHRAMNMQQLLHSPHRLSLVRSRRHLMSLSKFFNKCINKFKLNCSNMHRLNNIISRIETNKLAISRSKKDNEPSELRHIWLALFGFYILLTETGVRQNLENYYHILMSCSLTIYSLETYNLVLLEQGLAISLRFCRMYIYTGCPKSSVTDVKSHNLMIKTAFDTKIYLDIHNIPNNNFLVDASRSYPRRAAKVRIVIGCYTQLIFQD
uniref:Transmembrane protein n=1 Tax=Heterorhabditis bacteriophora TaxID=37862 RepID=A0A1I7WUQ6_HETBA